MSMMKKILIASAVMMTVTAVSPASAAVLASSTSIVNSTSAFDGESGTYGATVKGIGAFSTNFSFDVGKIAGNALVSISSVSVSTAAAIKGLSISLNGISYPVTSTMSLGGKSISTFGGFSQDVLGRIQTLTVSGTTASASSSFAGTLNFAAAVPEPASWALMIGGFALVGGALRRRSKTVRTTVSFA